MTLGEMVARTPPSRDRYVDFLRAFSISTVVVGHWFIAVIWWEDGRFGVHNAIGVTSGLWLGTWLLQVMPLFFFVGGFSNSSTLRALRRRGEGYRQFLRARAARLLAPTGVFIGAWLVVQVILHATETGGARLIRGTFLPFGPLWFLFVYLAVIALAPVMLALHARYRAWVPAALVAVAGSVDLARFVGDVPKIGWVNLAVVWLLAHQLGFFYADGSLVAAGRRVHAALSAAGLAILIVLTAAFTYPRRGPYPLSMIGTDTEAVSNMNPPTFAIAGLTLWLVGLAMLAREPVRRWLDGRRPWTAVIAANGVIMTMFLWHLTALTLAILALRPLGLGEPDDTTLSWWLQRPVWIGVPAVILTALVALFGRFERPRRLVSRIEPGADAAS